MSRIFHRALAVSVIGTAALAAPAAAMAADSGSSGTGETATSVVIHLPQRAQPGQPFTVTARIVPQDGVATPGSPDGDTDAMGSPDGSADGSTVAPDPAPDRRGNMPETRGAIGTDNGPTDTGKGKAKGPGHRKGAGHHKGKKGKTKAKRHAVTGEVTFFLDGKAQPPVEVTHDLASEQINVPIGRHTISAEYSGDANFGGADSPTVAFALLDGTQQDGGSQE
ncbi:Ig-like domain repeat protein [Actinospica durhamensis]|uniref:Ig-like domain repeat protein n=1 Tax=Actinospica durhamensis TaxID=1508375 RepID=A0A941IRT1_9ACTN|nr:Ig-like domain-containing protein [Actinospica durhamensis]MBR7837704.1 Ig-like domain repeat protein [Actinospica durhamensis]